MKKFVNSLSFGLTFLTLIVFAFAFSYLNKSITYADSTTTLDKSNSSSLKTDKSNELKAYIDPETGDFITPDIEELEQAPQISIPQSNIESKVQEQEELVEEDAPGGGKMVVLPNSFLNFMSVKIEDDGKLKKECHRNKN